MEGESKKFKKENKGEKLGQFEVLKDISFLAERDLSKFDKNAPVVRKHHGKGMGPIQFERMMKKKEGEKKLAEAEKHDEEGTQDYNQGE